jgi:hypothetical protein
MQGHYSSHALSTPNFRPKLTAKLLVWRLGVAA